MPTPSTPKVQSILANVKSVLEAVTAGSDYWFTWADVRICKDFALDVARSAATFPVAMVIPGDDTVTRRVMAGAEPVVDREMDLVVVGLHRDGPNRTEERPVLIVNEMASDITKALLDNTIVGGASSRNRGGYAIDTQLVSTHPFPEDFQGIDASIALKFKVIYRHQEKDPAAG